jgi:hypothetical protein
VAARGEVQLLCAAEQRRVEEMAELNGQMERCRVRGAAAVNALFTL